MSQARQRSNRTVYARVRIPARVLDYHIEAAFEERGWRFEREFERSYILSIPLYCARTVALQQAKGRIEEFSRQEFPVLLDEVRLLTPSRDNRRIGKVVWAPRGARKRKPGVEHLVPPFGAVRWEILVDRDESDDLKIRHERMKADAERRLKKSLLPGVKFDESTMMVATSAEPHTTVSDPWEAPARSCLAMVFLIIGFLAAIVGAAVVWADVGWFDKLLGGVFGGTASAWIAWWVTGDRIGTWGRIAAVGIALLLASILGRVFLEAFLIVGENGLFRALIGLLCALVALVLIIGWVHLFSMYTILGGLRSFAAIAGLMAAGGWASNLLIDYVGDIYGISPGLVDIPSWVRFAAALYAASWVGGAIFLIVGIFGWAVYFLGIPGSLAPKIMAYSILAVIVFLYAGVAAAFALWSTGSAAVGWYEGLRSGESPALVSSFMHHACLVSEDGSVVKGDPIPVIRGHEGVFWEIRKPEIGGPEADGGLQLMSVPVDVNEVEVVRVPADTEVCEDL